jgi:hypothetical protein
MRVSQYYLRIELNLICCSIAQVQRAVVKSTTNGGIGMQHDHSSFPEVMPAKKAWGTPSLTWTQLTAAELELGKSSHENLALLGRRLKAAGRI